MVASDDMLLADLATLSGRIAGTSGRNAKLGLLAEVLRRLEGAEIEIGVAWLSGHLRQGRIGLGPAQVRAAWKQHTPAVEPTLTVLETDETFTRIEATTGAGSTARRGELLGGLLARATSDEAEFLAKLVLGELRQGALAGLMEEAVARAIGVPGAELRRAVMLAGDLEAVARAALAEGPSVLAKFRLEIFQPIHPMLAQSAEDVDAALERLGEAAFEWKLDGARVQVHRAGSEVRVYTRNLNEVTEAVPEVVEAVAALQARELILDGEVVALRPDGSPLPFQVTMRRFGRRLDVAGLRGELPVTPFFFDLLRRDGVDLFDRPARERFAALREVAPALAVPQIVTADRAAAAGFYEQAMSRGHEGVMAKALDASYEAGRRGTGWLKVKREHTLDLVVLATEWGSGRRTGKLSNIHLGARDPATGTFVMLGKTFKGMTDEMLAWQTKRFQELQVSTDGWVVRVRPEQVVEITFNDIQESSTYPSGMALRFARVKRYRDDKPAAEADTIDTVRAILDAQGARPVD